MTLKISIKIGYLNPATYTEVWTFIIFKAEHNDGKWDPKEVY